MSPHIHAKPENLHSLDAWFWRDDDADGFVLDQLRFRKARDILEMAMAEQESGWSLSLGWPGSTESHEQDVVEHFGAEEAEQWARALRRMLASRIIREGLHLTESDVAELTDFAAFCERGPFQGRRHL